MLVVSSGDYSVRFFPWTLENGTGSVIFSGNIEDRSLMEIVYGEIG
jgi:hypothetical protein